eukprot:SAG31_NODE_1432_length_8373_cov_8.838289_1_plen_117_part_00
MEPCLAAIARCARPCCPSRGPREVRALVEITLFALALGVAILFVTIVLPQVLCYYFYQIPINPNQSQSIPINRRCCTTTSTRRWRACCCCCCCCSGRAVGERWDGVHPVPRQQRRE